MRYCAVRNGLKLVFWRSRPITFNWCARDGDNIQAGQKLCEIKGHARTLLSAERSALNFLQLLSAVATQTKYFVDAITGTQAVIVDTRKTLPGLRLAQKHAVKCGGGINHRFGLYDRDSDQGKSYYCSGRNKISIEESAGNCSSRGFYPD